jgi:hypothetical protein
MPFGAFIVRYTGQNKGQVALTMFVCFLHAVESGKPALLLRCRSLVTHRLQRCSASPLP